MSWEIVINKDADTDDTLKLIIATTNKYTKSKFVQEAAKKLCNSKDDLQNFRNVFEFYCRNVNYELDEPNVEKVYTPARTISEGKGDCKKASTFIAAVLKAAGYNPIFKHVTYGKNLNYTHIYVIVPFPTLDHYITLDPTNNCKFNSEVKYETGTLYYLNGNKMELKQMGFAGNDYSNPSSSINGHLEILEDDINSIGNINEFSNISSNLKKALANGHHKAGHKDFNSILEEFTLAHKFHFPNHPWHAKKLGFHFSLKKLAQSVANIEKKVVKAASNVEKEAVKDVKAVGKDIGKVAQQAVKLAKKAAWFIPRQAFLAIIDAGHIAEKELGVHYANHLADAWNSNPDKVKNFWAAWGGDPNALKKAILTGTGHQKNIKGIGEPVTLTAAVASAAPIVIAAAAFLKDTGIVKAGSPEDKALTAAGEVAVTADQAATDLENGDSPLETAADIALSHLPAAVDHSSKGGLVKKNHYQTTQGSFMSLGGFFFKSVLLLSCIDQITLINSAWIFIAFLGLTYIILRLIKFYKNN